jgi:hypothetical protein
MSISASEWKDAKELPADKQKFAAWVLSMGLVEFMMIGLASGAFGKPQLGPEFWLLLTEFSFFFLAE